jgi:hypothetical protein
MPDSSPKRGATIFRIAAIIYLIVSIILIFLAAESKTTITIAPVVGLLIIVPVVVFLIPFAFLPVFFVVGLVAGTPWGFFQWAWTILKRNFLVLVSIAFFASVLVCGATFAPLIAEGLSSLSSTF